MSGGRDDAVAGIYFIKHLPSGRVYVGQSNNIRNRWIQHRKQLRAGTHHNESLRQLSESASDADFEFEIVLQAPQGLTALQVQRWLVKEERKACQRFEQRGISLNVADPEIVPTPAAVKEYQKERAESRKAQDRKVSEQRRAIKSEIRRLQTGISTKQKRFLELRWRYEEKRELLKRSTGWRRIFYGRPSAFNPKRERRELQRMGEEISALAPDVHEVERRASELESEYRQLYRHFSKVSERMWHSTYSRALGRSPRDILIAE